VLHNDEYWPRASNWLSDGQGDCDLALFGVPAHQTAITPTNAHLTPAAIRKALAGYSLNSSNGSIESIKALDFGDVLEPDSIEGEARTTGLTKLALNNSKLAIALGGDNSITFAVARATLAAGGGLITLDAHHDIRIGVSNGSPIRRLIEEFGLPGNKIVQLGINDFSNSPEYTRQAKDFGIHIITRAEIAELGVIASVNKAMEAINSDVIHVDFDVDVCDRSFVPATPASAPGGISAFELRQFTREFCVKKEVRSIDITEIDATIDAQDQRTIKLAALMILEAAAGLLKR
jgi:formiminoglutamase